MVSLDFVSDSQQMKLYDYVEKVTIIIIILIRIINLSRYGFEFSGILRSREAPGGKCWPVDLAIPR